MARKNNSAGRSSGQSSAQRSPARKTCPEYNRLNSELLIKGEDVGTEFWQWVESQHENALDLLTFTQNRSHQLKITKTDVPVSILNNKIVSLSLYDIRVQCRGSDDVLYMNNREIRERIPRGLTLMTLKTRAGSQGWCCPIFALKKFTGGLGDEDDDETNDDAQKWERFFLKSFDSAKYIYSMQKENGAAGHLTFFELYGDVYWLGGSKNVHILARKEEDLLAYGMEQRYSMARTVMKTAFKTISLEGSGCEPPPHEYISDNHLTACFELCDPEDMHIELLDFPDPELRFISFSSFANSIENGKKTAPSSLCNAPQDIPGFTNINYEIFEPKSKTEIEELLGEIRLGHGFEGKVLYFVDEEYNVIGLIKKKTIWYVIIRAIREKMKFYLRTKPEDLLDCRDKNVLKIKARLLALQKWMMFDDAALEQWVNLALGFNDYMYEKISDNQIRTAKLFETKYPVMWNNFLEETNNTDKIDTTIKS